MEIRRYCHTDSDAIWELHILGLQHAGAYAGDGPWDDDLHHIDEVYLHNRGEFLVGVHEGRIIAMGAFRKTDNERAEIKRMRVHPDFHGHGYGQMILQELEVQAIAMGYSILHLDTSTIQLAAQSLYRKNGFKETGEVKVRRGFTEIFFEKRLS
jgi:ribosomal protein S18 acetylase RimI-like enzyme